MTKMATQAEHKAGLADGFTRKYRVDRLMHFESYGDSRRAAVRQRKLKGWRREKKIALFTESNPQWRDLTPEIFQTMGAPLLRQAQGRGFRAL
jgi:putative endonuclease